MAEERESVFAGACPGRIAELEAFTDSGDASKEMLDHIEACPACAAAVERICKVQTAGLEDLGRLIREARDADLGDAGESRAATVLGRALAGLIAVSAVALGLLVAELAVLAYGQIREQETGRMTRDRVDVLFAGALDGTYSADPAILCQFGGDQAACAAVDRHVWWPFPAPTKVYCQFDSWPRPHPVYGAAFIVVDGPDIVSYRYPNCPGGGAEAPVALEGGQPPVRQSPDAGAADECGAGPRIEVSRWRSRPVAP